MVETAGNPQNLLDPNVGVFWHPDHHEEACEFALGQLATLRGKLGPEARSDIGATEEIFRGIIDRYNDPSPVSENRLEYAFMVPIRTSASGDPKMPGFGDPNNLGPDYSGEISEFMPVAPHLNRFDAARLMRGLPPFVIDQLGEGAARGALVYTPISFDAAFGISNSGGNIDKAFGAISTATAEFAVSATGNLNAVVGLGAVLPRFTNFGRLIEGINTTTGHAGTLSTILSTLTKVEGEMFNGDLPNGHIGVMGNGAIGREAAFRIAEQHPGKTISLYDIKLDRAESLAKELEAAGISAEVHDNPNDFFKNTKVVVSAQTTPLDVLSLDCDNTEGVVIIDDSEPKSVTHDDARNLGVRIVNVLCAGRDDLLARNRFHYGRVPELGLRGWIGDASGEVFACQAEAAAIGNLALRDLERSRRMLVRGPASRSDIANVTTLFGEIGIVPARLQDAQGRLYGPDGNLVEDIIVAA